MDMKRFFLYFITIAALALAGCGGGGNGPDPADDTTMMNGNGNENGDSMAQATLDSVRDAVDAALGDDATDDLVVDIMTLVSQRDEEDPMLAAVRTALMTALGAKFPDSGDLVEAVNVLSPPSLGTPATTKAAATKLTAFRAEAAQTTDAGLGGDAGLGSDGATGTNDDPYSVTIKYDSVTVADSGIDDPKFKMADLP